MSFGSSEGLEVGFFEGAGTEPPLPDPAIKVNGDYGGTNSGAYIGGLDDKNVGSGARLPGAGRGMGIALFSLYGADGRAGQGCPVLGREEAPGRAVAMSEVQDGDDLWNP
jgi:hypothetical protein